MKTSKGRPFGRLMLWMASAVALAIVGCVLVMAAMWRGAKTGADAQSADEPALSLATGSTNTLELSQKLVHTLGVSTVQVQSAASHDRLKLSGSLFLDSNRMVRVHSRFPGEVVSIGANEQGGGDRPLRLGDRVTKGQLLAVIWSKDVGEKKSDLVNALSKLYLDDAQLKNLRSLPREAIGGQKVREAERDREADIIEIDRVERTLRSWRLSEAEIAVVRSEAEKIHKGDLVADIAVDKSWAEVEVRSPFDGIVLEKNIVAGDIVDTTLDLFRIADLNVLGVMANVYEEDLPSLETLGPDERRWTIYLKSQASTPGIPGKFDLIGNIVDPNQHTATVMGWLDNKDGRLRAGQFVTATVDLPAAAGEVVVPDTAIVQDGSHCLVFVASDESASRVTRRSVALVSRSQDVAYLRSQPLPDEVAKGCEPIRPGEWVVAAGSIELDGALENALATAPQRTSAPN